ncbi:Glutaredoxin-related protein 5, mitochondrial, partial [Eschrichtius robustus]|nr:Glutaredoxin-related protein 5, mitochondrial [Eschrichtius robustus]
MSGSLGRTAAALLCWGHSARGGLRGPGVRAASSGGSGSSEHLDMLVKKDRVVVFLKGTPEQPQCGFSNTVVQILPLHSIRDYAVYNVLDDPQLRQGIKAYSNWPTIPQVYLNSEFGCTVLKDASVLPGKIGQQRALVMEKTPSSVSFTVYAHDGIVATV